MLKQEEFNVLVTNVMAISNQILARHCGQFLSEVEATQGPGLNSDIQSLNEFSNEPPNYSEILSQGYNSVASMAPEFQAAWDACDQAIINNLVRALPSSLPQINKKFSENELLAWIEHFAILPEGNSFNDLHQYCHGLFNLGSQSDETIREAIADDDVSLLENVASQITASDIKFDDINTALMIESIKCFEWLVKRADISDEEVMSMLEYLSSDPEYFAKIYRILAPSKSQHENIVERVKELNEVDTLAFLDGMGG